MNMTKEEALKLIPEKSFVKYGKTPYRVAGVVDMFGAIMIEIYDEPPSYHVDMVKANSCKLIMIGESVCNSTKNE